MVGAYFPQLVVDAEHKHQMYPIKYHFARLLEELGYLHLQATKPDTIGACIKLFSYVEMNLISILVFDR